MIRLLARIVCAIVGHQDQDWESRALGMRLRRYVKCGRCERELPPRRRTS